MSEEQKLEEEFPSNSKMTRLISGSHRVAARNEEEVIVPPTKKIKKTIKGRGIRKKKTLSQSIAGTFFGEDTRSVSKYVLLFGETRAHSRSKSDKNRSVVSYGNFYRRGDRHDERDRQPSRSRGRFDLDSILFRRGDEAAEVLDGLCDLLEEYEQVTVADFYDLAGVEGGTWADQKWGWDNLSKAHCTHTRGGYTIVLPRPIELD